MLTKLIQGTAYPKKHKMGSDLEDGYIWFTHLG